ncbi:16S rRNA (guanine(527)-N(7))-methyltransferase RsmG [Govanella unica]|uniref:Ribosomal RNA small subunit methyltransferase G n=1 Tax=Govanella unica TaxID=2975056 RepID=A0A9X3Z5P7_9PROT|nr:16S rRNA (guanine(527)-N(7))-methyltransferase RsmG [Govania unica]MDA5192390.1 16S rRNA (guanine(527)-N(7))-methyltransferase RsmG [Govania unica]
MTTTVSEIETFGPEEFLATMNVPRETLDGLRVYVRVLLDWQERLNLVGQSTIPDLWRRHILDSAQILQHIPDWQTRPRVWADLGTGAGFPGMVLALMGAGHVHLFEKSPRKCQFLRAAAEASGADVSVHEGHSDEFEAGAVDVLVSRACAPLNRLLGLAAPFFGPNSVAYFHKGQNLDDELTEATKYWNMETKIFQSCTDPRGRLIRVKGLRNVR